MRIKCGIQSDWKVELDDAMKRIDPETFKKREIVENAIFHTIKTHGPICSQEEAYVALHNMNTTFEKHEITFCAKSLWRFIGAMIEEGKLIRREYFKARRKGDRPVCVVELPQ